MYDLISKHFYATAQKNYVIAGHFSISECAVQLLYPAEG